MRRVAIILSMALWLTACGSTGTENSVNQQKDSLVTPFTEEFTALKDSVNQEHAAIQKQDFNYEDYMNGAKQEMDLSLYSEENIGEGFAWEDELTYEQAEQDMEVLFDALQQYYGGYEYFGGDAAFETARNVILESCQTTGSLTGDELLELIEKNLAFIEDVNFLLEGRVLHKMEAPYLYKTVEFVKTGDTYQTKDGKQVVSVDGVEKLDELFRRSISGEGEIIYYPVVIDEFTALKYPEDLLVHYDDGTTDVLTTTAYRSSGADFTEELEAVELDTTKEVPILCINDMPDAEEQDNTLEEQIVKYTTKVKNEPILIVDLRNCNSGNESLSQKWFAEYTGDDVSANYSIFQRGNVENNPVEESDEDVFVANDKLLIILTSKSTAAGAEDFIDIAHNLENVLVIGENTMGASLGNMTYDVSLPNSRITFFFSDSIKLYPETGYYEEYRGIEPDIWVESDMAERAARRLILNAIHGEMPQVGEAAQNIIAAMMNCPNEELYTEDMVMLLGEGVELTEEEIAEIEAVNAEVMHNWEEKIGEYFGEGFLKRFLNEGIAFTAFSVDKKINLVHVEMIEKNDTIEHVLVTYEMDDENHQTEMKIKYDTAGKVKYVETTLLKELNVLFQK